MASLAHGESPPVDTHPSSRSLSEDTSSSSAAAPRRRPSIVFSSDTRDSRSPTSYRNRRGTLSDETTPIQSADRSEGRNYHTTNAPSADSVFDDAPGTSQGRAAKAVDPSNGASDSKSKPSPPWYRRVIEKYGSVSLENKGSVARDHLALERTFLAWLRTSLAFASIGIAVTQLFRLNTSIASRSQQLRAEYSLRRKRAGGELPFSPFLGHSLDVGLANELYGYPVEEDIGSTLLDQFLTVNPLAFDEDAAAKLRHVGKPLGATFLAVSIVVLFVGCHRYFEAQHWIIRGKFPSSRGSVGLVGLMTSVLIVASLVVVLVVAPSSFEK